VLMSALVGLGCAGQASAAAKAARGVQFATVDGTPLLLDVYPPENGAKPLGLIVWVHGGAWRAGSRASPDLLGLTARGFARLERVGPGFVPDDTLSVQLSLPPSVYADRDALVRFSEALQDRLAAIPGVENTGSVSLLPLSGLLSTMDVAFPDRPAPPPDDDAQRRRRRDRRGARGGRGARRVAVRRPPHDRATPALPPGGAAVLLAAGRYDNAGIVQGMVVNTWPVPATRAITVYI